MRCSSARPTSPRCWPRRAPRADVVLVFAFVAVPADLGDGDLEQVERRLRPPADRVIERDAVGLALPLVVHVAGDPVELEVALGPALVGDRVVDDTARIAQ